MTHSSASFGVRDEEFSRAVVIDHGTLSLQNPLRIRAETGDRNATTHASASAVSGLYLGSALIVLVAPPTVKGLRGISGWTDRWKWAAAPYWLSSTLAKLCCRKMC